MEDFMKQTFLFTKEFQAFYEIVEQGGIKTITVIIPGFGKKATQLGDLPVDSIAKTLANDIFVELEAVVTI